MAICGVDIDAKALRNAQQIIEANGLQQQISLRQQANPVNIFKGVNTARGAIYIDHMQPAFMHQRLRPRHGQNANRAVWATCAGT